MTRSNALHCGCIRGERRCCSQAQGNGEAANTYYRPVRRELRGVTHDVGVLERRLGLETDEQRVAFYGTPSLTPPEQYAKLKQAEARDVDEKDRWM